MCLQCNNAAQPRHCHAITYCAEDEVCFVEKVESMYGVRFNMGCMKDNDCREQNETNRIETHGEGNKHPYTCTGCCRSDLCNAEGCGEPGYPTARGPICFACYQHANARECRKIAHCRESELCYIKEEEEFGDRIFSTGCMPFQQCLSVVSNLHAVGDLSNSHHFSRSSTTVPTSVTPRPVVRDTASPTVYTSSITTVNRNTFHANTTKPQYTSRTNFTLFPPNTTTLVGMQSRASTSSPIRKPTGITNHLAMVNKSTTSLPNSTDVPTGMPGRSTHSSSRQPTSWMHTTSFPSSSTRVISPVQSTGNTTATANLTHKSTTSSSTVNSKVTGSLTPTPDYFTVSPPSTTTGSTTPAATGTPSTTPTITTAPTTTTPTITPAPTTTTPTITPAPTTTTPTITPAPTTITPTITTTPTTITPTITPAPTTITPTITTTPTTTTAKTNTTTTTTTTTTTKTTTPTTTTTNTTTTATTMTTTTFPIAYKGLSGKEFLLAFSKHQNHENADNISLVVTSPDNGKISIYSSYTKSFINMTLTKGRNTIFLDPSVATSIPWNEHKGLHISSDVNISVTVMEYKNDSDTAFSLIPISDLSNRYVAVTAKGTKETPSFITVVGLHNGTDVRFNLRIKGQNKYVYISPWRNYRYENGESFNVTLNQYETFQLEVNGSDLTGTIIDSTGAVAVFSGAEAAVIPSTICNLHCESQTVTQMIPPTNALGTDFIIPKLEERNKFVYKIISSEDATQVIVDEQTVTLPTAGSFSEFETENKPVNISSNKPILVVQMAETMRSEKGNASGAMIVIPAIQQYQSDYHFSTPEDYRNYISIITKAGEEMAILIDGMQYSQYNATKEKISLHGQPFTVINIPLHQPGSHDIQNIQGDPFGLITYGFNISQGYGYPVGLKLTHQ
ncbi:mucin-2-like isoform X3 [Ostrea edulis]|uniref:mucin-2-like isoform X3 n=1 Tax=Ostrea edulis TaxID=37623 RepID=UPI0024AF4386|nr:mucin-2-like isoform X3 [Ostrea edulis]